MTPQTSDAAQFAAASPPPRAVIHPERRKLVPPWPFRDPERKQQAEDLFLALAAEFAGRSVTELRLLWQLTCTLMMDADLRAVQALTVALKEDAAAREVVSPGYSHFQPGAPGFDYPFQDGHNPLTRYQQGYPQADGDPAAVRTKALQTLAERGLDEAAVGAKAFDLALDVYERLEKIRAGFSAEQNTLISDLLRLRVLRETKAK